MRRLNVLTIAMVIAMVSNYAQAGVSLVVNGSFEKDGKTISNITPQNAPYYWSDVSLPTNKFRASLLHNWSTHGDYYVKLYSDEFGTFTAGAMGTISQQVYLTDVNEIIFDLKLSTYWGDQWNPAIRSAVMLIDDNVVWESNSVGTDVRGTYLNQVYTVDPVYKDGMPHKLSLGLKAKTGGSPYIEYDAQWDFIKFNTHCGGFGYLDLDFDHSCYVDMNDFQFLAEQWLVESPSVEYDLFEDENSIVNFKDVAVIANEWMTTSWWADYDTANFVEPELVLVEEDLDFDGIVGFGEMQMLADNWLAEDDGLEIDFNDDGIINFEDFAVVAEKWFEKSSTYYWE